jgi:protoheme ferro-lyase
MTLIEIENNLHSLVANFSKETFIFDLLLAYGTPKSTIKHLEGSDHDKLASNGELTLRKKLLFKVVLNERDKHSQKTLAQLYDTNKMPEGLRKAHHALDKAIEQCYRPKPFESYEERLEYLFKMYEEMANKDKK